MQVAADNNMDIAVSASKNLWREFSRFRSYPLRPPRTSAIQALTGHPAFRTPRRRSAQVIPAIQAQPELPPMRLTTVRPQQPVRRGEGEEQRGEPSANIAGPAIYRRRRDNQIVNFSAQYPGIT